MEISVVIPAYLEAENLVNILPRLTKNLSSINVDHEIIVVDTIEEMDNTKEVCKNNNVIYLNRFGGNLYGDAIRSGFEKAKGRFIIVMDADGSHNPNDIVRLYNKIKKNKCTLVIGSRYCKGGYTDNNFILRFMSWMLNVTYRVLFGLKVKDVSDSFRIYDSSELKKILLECNDFDIVEEILIKLKYNNKSFVAREIPISFHKRVAGESKRDLLKFIWSYLKTIRKLLAIKHQIKYDNKR